MDIPKIIYTVFSMPNLVKGVQNRINVFFFNSIIIVIANYRLTYIAF